MDQPSYQQRALEDEAEDEAALEQLGKDEEQRQWRQPWTGNPIDMLDDDLVDGRAGLSNADRPEVAFILVMFALGIVGFLLFALRSCGHGP